MTYHHRLGYLPFCCSHRQRGLDIDGQTAAIFHQRMPQIAQPRFVALRFLVETCSRISGRGMRIVLAGFALEIHRRVTPAAIRPFAQSVPSLEALHRRPGADVGAAQGFDVSSGALNELY
jgi:hypothetical protein